MVATQYQVKTYSPWAPQPYFVQRVKRETQDTYTLELRPTEGEAMHFLPGQFNMLYVFGVGEVPISISGDPLNRRTLVHTVRDVGAVTKAICKMKPGDMLGVRGPFGAGWPVELALGCDVVVVAGGVGLAPVRPIIYHILANREKYGDVVLLYGARTPGDMLYEKELEHWRGRFDLEVAATVDSADAGWHGHVGVVTKLIPRAGFDADEAIAMVCGPEVMMRFTIRELQGRGLTDEQIYVSMERNMKCAIGFCGHCQYGPHFICKDGPVFRYDQISGLFGKREV